VVVSAADGTSVDVPQVTAEPVPPIGAPAHRLAGSSSPQIAAGLQRFSVVSGWAVTAIGVLVVTGWFADVEILKRGWPSLITMKFHTAVCFVALGLGIVSLHRRPRSTLLLAGLAGVVPLLTLIEYVTGRHLGIDNPFGFDTTAPGPTTIPGRMAPATATCFVLGAAALAGHSLRRPLLPLVTSLAGLVIGTLNLMGYAYGVESLYRFTYTSVAVHTALAFVVADLALLVARPFDRPIVLLTSRSAGGALARRMLPTAIVLPLVTGALVAFLLHLRADVDPPLAFAAFTMAMGCSLGVITWVNAARLDRADERRVDAERVSTLLARSEERMRRILETASEAFVALDRGGHVTDWNRQAELTFGWTAAEALGRPLHELIIPPEDVQAHLDGLARFLATGEVSVLGVRRELDAVDRHGRRFPVELMAWAVETDGSPEFNGFIQDVSARKAADTALHQSNERLHQLADEAARQRDFSSVLLHAMDHGYLLTIDGKIVEVNDQLCDLVGFSADELIGSIRPYPSWPPEAHDLLADIGVELADTGTADLELELVHKNGERVPVALAIRSVHNSDNSIHAFLTTVTDLTDFRAREKSLIATAGRDPLTGLYNRRSIDEQFADLQPNDAVIIIDLDHFKLVNDTFGHAAGDETLVAFAQCMQQVVRDTDWVGRLGGEEFLVVVRNGQRTGIAVVDRLRTAWAVNDRGITFSAGLAVHQHHADPNLTLARADEAVYRAKENGRDRTEYWVAEPVSSAAPA
jgi:diguanylate cyclase (GGDEF)-like protein/PAS domain S-box-containing protein